MKRFTFLTFLSIAFVSGMILMSSCTKEGPAGATGAQGATGATGAAGEDGINGTDGTAGCIVCHDGDQSQGMFAQINQWEASTHANGGNFERNGASCAQCHTSQGHREFIATGTVAADVSNPNPINCYTCHEIHETYTAADLKLVGDASFTTILGDVVDFGKGNVCANCHQSRPLTVPDPAVATYTITSSRFGSHHGPQTQIFSGVGLVNFDGDEGYGGNMHMNQITDGCVTCHMAEPYGVQAGGHTWAMDYEYHGSAAVWLAGCTATGCHGDTDADADALHAKIEELQEGVELKLEELAVLLKAAGVMKSSGSVQTGTHNSVFAGAYLNYQSVTEDKSRGIHNPTYVKALLQNSIDAVTAELP